MLLHTSYGGGPAVCPPVQLVGGVGLHPSLERSVPVPVSVSPSREPYKDGMGVTIGAPMTQIVIMVNKAEERMQELTKMMKVKNVK
eukprot:10409212-Ditylum_brightwellii.AAC.1